MVVHNEAAVLRRKIVNLLGLKCPSEHVELLIVSDGSTDGTNEVLKEFANVSRLRVLLRPESQGKAAGLNEAMRLASGDIVIFTDARQEIGQNAIRFLLENFADPQVGCVSGELILGDAEGGESTRGMGLYWRLEKQVRELESILSSVVGATGALYATRRTLLAPLPPETILDDVYIPMHVARQGFRVVFESRARALDVPDLGTPREFARKVRTLSGNYQLLRLSPWLLSSSNPIRFQFVSHKLMRLLVPIGLAALLLSSIFLTGVFYRLALIFQVAFYVLGLGFLAGLKRGPLARIADAACTFVLLNAAALVALAKFLTGRRAVWAR